MDKNETHSSTSEPKLPTETPAGDPRETRLGFSEIVNVEAKAMSGCTKQSQSNCGIGYRMG